MYNLHHKNLNFSELASLKVADFSYSLAPSSHTYPTRQFFVHFPTNEENFDQLYFKNKLYPVDNLASLNNKERGAILCVGPELGVYYGEKFGASGLINIDINPSLSAVWLPLLVYISNFPPHKHTELINNFYTYTSLWNILNVPTRSAEHQKLQLLAQQKKAATPAEIINFINMLSPDQQQLLKYFRGYSPGLKKEQKEWPLFINKQAFPFLKNCWDSKQLLFIHGSFIEAASYTVIKKSALEKIKLIYLSNLLDYLSSAEKQLLKKYLLGLKRTENCLAIVSAINKNYLYTFSELVARL